jgi:hypothetical protein
MANELQFAYGVTGRTLYAVVRSSTAAIWNGSALVSFNDANWATYAVGLIEQGSSGFYIGDFPAVAAGTYNFEVRNQAGGSPAISPATDAAVGIGQVEWDGAVVVSLASRFAGAAAPANFTTLSINASGHLSRVTLADTVITLIGYAAPDNSSIAAIKAKTDNLPPSPAAVGSPMTLTSAYDAAKTASQFNAASDAVLIAAGSGAALAAATAAAVTNDHGAGSYVRNTEPSAANDVAIAVWDLSTTGHTTAGTFGAAMATAGSAGDPWITSLPGSYPEGTAGFMLGNQALQTGDSYARLGAPATTSIAADIAAIETGGDFSTAILTVTPDSRLVDSAGNPVTSVSVAQALAALFVNLLGDRSGIGSRSITAAIPGTSDCTVTAERVSRSVIQATITLPAAG